MTDHYTTDPVGQVADEAYVAGYQDGVTQALRWAATEWPEDGMTRAEAQAWLEHQAARLLCAGHQGASPTRQPCAACVAATTVWTCPDCEGAEVAAAVLALADDWDDFEHDPVTCPKYDCGDCTMKNAVYDLRTCVESVTGTKEGR